MPRERVACTAVAFASVLVIAFLTTGVAHAQAFVPFEAPCAGTGAYQGTVPVSINTAGTTTGFCLDSQGDVSYLRHGFVRAANGKITAFDAPGAGTGNGLGTIPTSINTAGVITGTYTDASNVYHGFVRAAKNPFTVTPLNVTEAGTVGHTGTEPLSINAGGTITGTYRDAKSVYHGFVRASDGTITTFNVTNAGTGHNQGTTPISINTTGAIVGTYVDASGVYHGFLRVAKKTITFDCSGASEGSNSFIAHFSNPAGTIPLSINAMGVISGTCTVAGERLGFVRDSNGKITTFTAPGAGTDAALLEGTLGINVNDSGVITGTYVDANKVAHGFVRTAKGIITPFNATDAGTGMLQGTVGVSSNAGGAIAGTYIDAGSVFHVFVLTSPTTP